MNKLIVSVLVHHNSPYDCISLVRELAYLPGIHHRVVVVDNQSEPENLSILKAGLNDVDGCHIIQNPINGGYGQGMNLGVSYAQKFDPAYIQVINTDVTVINQHYLASLIDALEQDKCIGAIGPCVAYKDGSIQNTILPQVSLKSALFYRSIKTKTSFSESNPKPYSVDVINGVCMIIPNSIYHQLGGFDESFFMYGEENDLCFRIQQAGYKVCFWSGTSIVHYEEHNRVSHKTIQWRDLLVRSNQVLFLQKHKGPFTAWLVSLVFAINLILKLMLGYRIKGYSLMHCIHYLFNPLQINKSMIK